jgi:hypothetical protein
MSSGKRVWVSLCPETLLPEAGQAPNFLEIKIRVCTTLVHTVLGILLAEVKGNRSCPSSILQCSLFKITAHKAIYTDRR